MTDREAFLCAIRKQPDNDLPRLVFADWLADHDEPARAEFIRVQCELAKIPSPSPTRQWDDPLYSCGSRWGELRQRERELLKANVGTWTAGLPDALVSRVCPACVEQGPDPETNAVECRRCDSTGFVPNFDAVEFRRGFVVGLDLDWPTCRDQLDAIRREHPIERVELTTAVVIEAETPGVEQCRLEGSENWVDGRWLASFGEFRWREHNLGDISRALLRLRWPGIRFTLPPTRRFAAALPQPALHPDTVRRQVEAAVDREMPGGRIEWVTERFGEAALRSDRVVITHFECSGNPNFQRWLTEAHGLPSRSDSLLVSSVELRRLPFAVTEDARQAIPVYRGRCPDCGTTFLALGRT